MFNRKKKKRNYDDDYEDYYDEHDEYDEFDDYDDDYDDDEFEEEIYKSTKKSRPENSIKREPSEGAMRKQELELQQEQATVIEHLTNENQQFQKEVHRQKTMSERLKSEVENKQQEIDQLTMRLTSSSKSKERILLLEEKVRKAEELGTQLEEQLLDERNKNLENEKQMRQQDLMKNQIAEVLMEAKEKAQQIIERATIEADRTVEAARHETKKAVSEASIELKMINQEAANYHTRILRLQNETSILMEDLLNKSSRLADQSLD
ncbi:hypothetical protein [Enterococcus sp. 5H]|uniref:hypothetical protein n=1 Tax=Enterococcus sp. 5H TaxID=1229490 RepID=UPI0023035E5D|nr:hypothetical protein [Enterococcus sp. 5H]